MAINATMARQHLGRMVHVHSIYGWHRGVVTHVMPNGIMLGNPVRVASCDIVEDHAFSALDYQTCKKKEEYDQIFFGGGFFLPFGGIYGMYPFGFGGFLW